MSTPPPTPTPAPRADAATLALRDVGRRYGATVALHGLSLTVEPGTVHALIGENGAGKSTATQIAAGVDTPSSGELLLDGVPVTFNSARDAEASGIRLIPQELQLYESLSIAENLYVGRARPRARGIVRAARMRRRASDVLRRLGVEAPPSARVEQLSPATRQLV